jgi:hypothetical protein
VNKSRHLLALWNAAVISWQRGYTSCRFHADRWIIANGNTVTGPADVGRGL